MVTEHGKQVDRLRRQAISKYIADHRADLLRLLRPAQLKDRNTERRELERVGRIHFNREPPETQGQYMPRRAEETPASGVPESQGLLSPSSDPEQPRPKKDGVAQAAARPRSSGVSGSRPRKRQGAVVQAASSSTAAACPTTSYVTPKRGLEKTQDPKRGLEKTQAAASCPKRLRTSETVDSHWVAGRASSVLHDQLVRCTKNLRVIYGDATTFEILAVGMRMLDHVNMQSQAFRSFRVGVKVAAVVGVAAKKVHSGAEVAEDHVITLWAKIAGKSSEPQVRQVEKMFVVQWARAILDSGDGEPR